MQHATFRQLEVFLTVARQGSFTRAAESLGLSQPTVSMQIKKLSDEVGLALFESHGKGMQLTEAGRALEATCREIFDALDRFAMTVTNLQGLRAGSLKLAIVNTAKYIIPLILGAFCQRYPDIDAQIEITDRERLLTRLVEHRDDLYIVSQPPQRDDVKSVAFMANPLVIVAPMDHPLTRRALISPGVIAQEPFLLREQGSGTRRAVERFFQSRGFALKVRMTLANNEGIKQAVIGGLGIAALSRHALGNDLALGQLAILDVKGFPLKEQWYALAPAHRPLSVVAESFLSFLQTEGEIIVRDKLNPSVPVSRRLA
ncbi:MAG: LysR family transcriptional regulator [Candidatus Competibacterales bacterium]